VLPPEAHPLLRQDAAQADGQVHDVGAQAPGGPSDQRGAGASQPLENYLLEFRGIEGVGDLRDC